LFLQIWEEIEGDILNSVLTTQFAPRQIVSFGYLEKEEGKMYAIMRFAKLKSWGEIGGVGAHHSRDRTTPNANSSIENLWLERPTESIVEGVRDRLKNIKIRKNGVLAYEFLLSASPEFFRPEAGGYGQFDRQKVDTFNEKSMEWLRDIFGSENIVSAICHLDEASPHIQAVVTPVDRSTGKLNARGWTGGREKLEELQDTFAEALTPLGLERGIKGSRSTHTRISEFYASVEAARPPDMPKIEVERPPMLLSGTARDAWAETEGQRLEEIIQPRLQPMADQAAAGKLERKRREEYEQTLLDLRRSTESIRDIPLVQVLSAAGYSRDKDDSAKWRGPAGVISIDIKNGKSRFFNHSNQKGGGGAIDLSIHLFGFDFKGAVAWLGSEFRPGLAVGAALHSVREVAIEAARQPTPLPVPDALTWPRARDYLIKIRGLSPKAVDILHEKGRIFSDGFANLAFVYTHLKTGEGVGCELRGTDPEIPWKGFRGVKKATGFWIRKRNSREVVIVESAIDAISFAQLHPDRICDVVSLGGVGVAQARQIAQEANKTGRILTIGFDCDMAGDQVAAIIHREFPQTQRLVSTKGKDWNEELLKSPLRFQSNPAPSAPDFSFPSSRF
jgi:5S rRNA maturation endonuclease (ribonuclease M5)